MTENRDFVTSEFQKIYNDPNYAYPLNLALSTAWLLAHFKGINLKILDIRNQSSLGDYFVLASGHNKVQLKSMSQEILRQTKSLKCQIRTVEGEKDADWILIDLGDIIVHLFQEISRDVYDLDEIYRDSSHVAIPQSFYIDGQPINTSNDNNDSGFF